MFNKCIALNLAECTAQLLVVIALVGVWPALMRANLFFLFMSFKVPCRVPLLGKMQVWN